MKINFKTFMLFAGIMILMASCNSIDNQQAVKLAPGEHMCTVEEIIQTSAYTYLRAMEGEKEIWLAIEKQEIKKGGTYFFMDAMDMADFKSKELNRTFKSILFVQKFSDKPLSAVAKTMPVGASSGKKAVEMKEGISVKPAEGGITIADLFSKRDTYAGKTVKIRGEVVKFNSDIMKTNWVHIQDGTIDSGNFDLTLTTSSVVKVGDIVIFEGPVTLNKDFGAGYSYEVIIQDARLLTNL
jgi:hypothetical protein